MSAIKEVVLFWSQFSKPSIACKKYITSINMPVRFLKVDSPSIRERITHGENFSIKVVPSLMVLLADDNVNIFQGKTKILKWIASVIQKPKLHKPQSSTPQKSMVHDKLIHPPPSQKSQHSQQPRNQRNMPVEETFIQNEAENGDSNIEFIGGEEEFEGTELIFSDEPLPPPVQTKSPLPTKGLMTGPSAKKGNESIMMNAKKMMAERDGTLGYGPEKQG